MKKVMATLLAGCLLLGSVLSASAASISKSSSSVSGYSLTVGPGDDNAEYSDGAPEIYTYGTDSMKEAEIAIIPESGYKITDMDVSVNTSNISASYKKNDGTVSDPGVLTIKGKAGVRVFELEDYELDLDITLEDDATGDEYDVTITIYGEELTAYSPSREVESDETYTITKSLGCIFEFDEYIDEETRIRVDDDIDLYFNGNYGTDYENLRVVTDSISEIDKALSDLYVDYYDFIASPKFATAVEVEIKAGTEAYIYEYNKKTGDLTLVDAEYDGNWIFETKTLGTYIVTDEEIDESMLSTSTADEDSTDDTEYDDVDSVSDSEKTNPGTGAAGSPALAVLLGIGSLCAAGLAAYRKAAR